MHYLVLVVWSAHFCMLYAWNTEGSWRAVELVFILTELLWLHHVSMCTSIKYHHYGNSENAECFTFAKCIISGTRQTAALPSVPSETLGIRLHSAKSTSPFFPSKFFCQEFIFAECLLTLGKLFAECRIKNTRQTTVCQQINAVCCMPSVTLGKAFAECFWAFAECPWHSANLLYPVVYVRMRYQNMSKKHYHSTKKPYIPNRSWHQKYWLDHLVIRSMWLAAAWMSTAGEWHASADSPTVSPTKCEGRNYLFPSTWKSLLFACWIARPIGFYQLRNGFYYFCPISSFRPVA